MTKYILIAFIVFAAIPAFAQKRFTVSGTIKDTSTGETLIGAIITIKEMPEIGTVTNSYGFYSLSMPQGDYTIVFSYTGYESCTKNVILNNSLIANISLSSKNVLNEVVVKINKPNNDQIISPQMGVEKLSMSQINNLPVVLGEKDVLKTISLLPGVESANEGNTGFYVRGGASDQNLILLDEAPVYNASHLLGLFSTFNSDAIKDVSLFKGAMPAEYGGRLSSVLDIKMLDGNNRDLTVQGGIGLIASRLKIEGPVAKHKGSFMVSARRSYIDLFTKAVPDSIVKRSQLYFYDINAKINYHFNDKNILYVSGYFGKDVLGLNNVFGNNWGNATGTIRFNHLFNDRLFSNTSLIYSSYNYEIESFLTNDDFKSTSKIVDYNLKEDLQYSLSNNHTLKFGINILYHSISPGDITSSAASGTSDKSLEQRYGFENAAYVSDEWKASKKLNILYGLRLSDMALLGGGTFKTYDANGNALTSEYYGSGSVVKSYLNLEPRLSGSYQLNEDNSIKASYSRNTQNIHLLNNTNGSTQQALYILSSNNVKPGIADQISTGWFRNFKENSFEFSAEVYYKWLQNEIDYKDGAQLFANPDVESQLTFGSGRAYGLELLLKKKYGRFNGWVGYTLSRVEDKFAQINNGSYFPATQDHTHNLSIVGNYKLNKRWTLSSSFIYITGNAVSFPTGKYNIGGLTTFSYSERDGYREPSNNRLDIGATWEGRQHKKYHSSWTFSIYNLYGHWDPYTITFQDNGTSNKTEVVETSIFPKPIPSITWNFKFQ